MGNGGLDTLTHAERIATHKVGTLAVGVVKGVEEVGGGWGEQVGDVLLESVDVVAGGVLGNL